MISGFWRGLHSCSGPSREPVERKNAIVNTVQNFLLILLRRSNRQQTPPRLMPAGCGRHCAARLRSAEFFPYRVSAGSAFWPPFLSTGKFLLLEKFFLFFPLSLFSSSLLFLLEIILLSLWWVCGSLAEGLGSIARCFFTILNKNLTFPARSAFSKKNSARASSDT